MKALIICQSIHHENTMKVAKVMTKVLGATIKKPTDVEEQDFVNYDIIGFGSWIYNGKHHISLFKLIESIDTQNNKKSFVFSTATICYKKMHEPFKQLLIKKWFTVVDEFMCKGFIDYWFLKYFFGGLNKHRPDEQDLAHAKEFALHLKEFL